MIFNIYILETNLFWRDMNERICIQMFEMKCLKIPTFPPLNNIREWVLLKGIFINM